MKRLWITDSGIIHHRKPRMDATEYVEVQQQPDAELLEAIKDLQPHWDADCEVFPDTDSIGWKGDEELPTTFGQIRRLKQAIARAEQRCGLK